MFHRGRPRSGPTDVRPMSRGSLLALLGGGALLATVLSGGLGYTLCRAATAALPTTPAAGQQSTSTASTRDLIAAAPMLAVDPDAGLKPALAISPPSSVRLPVATTTGPAGVPSGFPHTPEGAAAQLAAVEVRVLTAMSIPVALDTYESWSTPGGVGAADWSQTRNVASFLTGARQQANTKDLATIVGVVPAGYQIKGTDGPDWVLACVLLDVHATIRDDARMGYGTCERMQWTEGRWVIAPGTPPAAAPSCWPGSDLAAQAGWRPLTRS